MTIPIAALAVVAVLFLFVCCLHLVLLRATGSMIRQHARERDLLMNQLLNLAGKPWQPPPSEPPFVAPELAEYAIPGWNPDQ